MSPGLDAIPPLLTEVERVAGLEKITPMELLERLMGVYEEMEEDDLTDPVVTIHPNYRMIQDLIMGRPITADHSYDDDQHHDKLDAAIAIHVARSAEVVKAIPPEHRTIRSVFEDAPPNGTPGFHDDAIGPEPHQSGYWIVRGKSTLQFNVVHSLTRPENAYSPRPFDDYNTASQAALMLNRKTSFGNEPDNIDMRGNKGGQRESQR